MGRHHGCCGAAGGPCDSSAWPSTLYLTTAGQTVTLAKFGPFWTGSGTFAAITPQCGGFTTMQMSFSLQCDPGGSGVLQITYGWPVFECPFNYQWYPVFNGCSTATGTTLGNPTFVNSPLVFSGTWGSVATGPLIDGGCVGTGGVLTQGPPLAGLAFSGTQ